jgi:hypothetical protein
MCSCGRRVSRGMPIRLFRPLPTATNDQAASDAGPDSATPSSHCSSGYPRFVAGRQSLVFVMMEGYRGGAANHRNAAIADPTLPTGRRLPHKLHSTPQQHGMILFRVLGNGESAAGSTPLAYSSPEAIATRVDSKPVRCAGE